jgi:hypothetical protein
MQKYSSLTILNVRSTNIFNLVKDEKHQRMATEMFVQHEKNSNSKIVMDDRR